MPPFLTAHQRAALRFLLARRDEDSHAYPYGWRSGFTNLRCAEVGLRTARHLEALGFLHVLRTLTTTRGSAGRCPTTARERPYCDVNGWLTVAGIEAARTIAVE